MKPTHEGDGHFDGMLCGGRMGACINEHLKCAIFASAPANCFTQSTIFELLLGTVLRHHSIRDPGNLDAAELQGYYSILEELFALIASFGSQIGEGANLNGLLRAGEAPSIRPKGFDGTNRAWGRGETRL